jgi:3-hydroxyisobutyrate dehydrogenase-like beta-hydroxyacid dehydrogenase
MRVAWIGLGNMGLPMATNVLAAGHDVAGFDVRPDAVAALVELGGRGAASPSEAAAGAEIVSVAVLDGSQVEAATTGPAGVYEAAGDGTVVAIHSTVHPRTVHAAAAGAPDDVVVLDAPISGGVQGARAGTLCVMVGGPTDGFERARPVLDAVGDLVLHLGERGAGLAAKLARNLVGYVSMLGVQEGRALAAAAGTDAAQLATILEHTGTLSPMMRDLLTVPGGDAVYSRDLAPLVALAAKDLRAALDLGDDLGVGLPAAALTLEHVAVALGGRDPA